MNFHFISFYSSTKFEVWWSSFFQSILAAPGIGKTKFPKEEETLSDAKTRNKINLQLRIYTEGFTNLGHTIAHRLFRLWKFFGPVEIEKFGNKIGSIKTIGIPCASSESKANMRKKMGAAIRTGERMLVPKNHAGK